ncbi:phage tail tube protein [Oceaniglobus trochenteri]|uniref:phage tail tube protein n=1 Tax=Oceaniglobus trochenteri TaxID=2763260 RepID=UPI001CFF8E0C|nr:phage tail tube protein [Oceaniglobus trochenteri]
MPIRAKTKILLFKIEDTYGTDPAPLAVNGVLASSIELSPMEGEDIDRDLELPHLGNTGTIPTGLHARMTFKVELAGSGEAGTAPAWGPLLRACAVAETIVDDTSVSYAPRTDGHESATIYFQMEGTRYVLRGARGTCKIELSVQTIPYLTFTFTGLFTEPAEENRIEPDLSSFQKPLAFEDRNSPTFTLDAIDMVARSCALDLGNQVETRFLINSESVLIPDRAETLEVTVEALPLNIFDPYARALAQDDVALVLTHGKTAGNIATLSVPKAQMQRPQGLEMPQNLLEWPLRLSPLPVARDDQWTLTLT